MRKSLRGGESVWEISSETTVAALPTAKASADSPISRAWIGRFQRPVGLLHCAKVKYRLAGNWTSHATAPPSTANHSSQVDGRAAVTVTETGS